MPAALRHDTLPFPSEYKGMHKEIYISNSQVLINAVLQASEHNGPHWDKPQGSPCHYVIVSPCTPVAPNQAVPHLPRRQQSELQHRGDVRVQAAWGDMKENLILNVRSTSKDPFTSSDCACLQTGLVWVWLFKQFLHFFYSLPGAAPCSPVSLCLLCLLANLIQRAGLSLGPWNYLQPLQTIRLTFPCLVLVLGRLV